MRCDAWFGFEYIWSHFLLLCRICVLCWWHSRFEKVLHFLLKEAEAVVQERKWGLSEIRAQGYATGVWRKNVDGQGVPAMAEVRVWGEGISETKICWIISAL